MQTKLTSPEQAHLPRAKVLVSYHATAKPDSTVAASMSLDQWGGSSAFSLFVHALEVQSSNPVMSLGTLEHAAWV